MILITTLDADSPWLASASPGVRTVEFGKLARDLSEEEKITVLTRLLLELAPRIIHNVQSDLGWRCLAQHGRALRSNGAVLIGSVFCDEVGADGHQFGYAITYISKVRDLIDLILTDSTPYRDTLRRRYRLPGPRVQCVPFWHAPPPLTHGGLLPAAPAKGAAVLFAGRFCYQKRPDILFAVAEACKDVAFHVFGEADATKFAKPWRNKLSTAPNVTLYGAYDAFNSVAARQTTKPFSTRRPLTGYRTSCSKRRAIGFQSSRRQPSAVWQMWLTPRRPFQSTTGEKRAAMFGRSASALPTRRKRADARVTPLISFVPGIPVRRSLRRWTRRWDVE